MIESYQSLQQDPNDVNSFLLQQILLQLSTNSSADVVPSLLPPPFTPSTTNVRVNVFWFMSLSLSLSTVFVGILCMQWLREYQRSSPLDPQEVISLRQLRYQGLMAWKVPEILMSLPILLYASLILFFVGLIDLLWSVNLAVAISVTVISALVLLFLLATTLLPSLQLYFISDNQLRKPQCPYKSPQSWSVHRLVTSVVQFTNPSSSIFKTSFRVVRYKPFFADKSWVDHDKRWLDARNKPHTSQANGDIVQGLTWIDKHLGQSIDMAFAMYNCIRELPSVASKQLLFSINEKAQQHLSSPRMVEYLNSTTEEERREVIATIFLEINNHVFPQLDQYQLESVIRILNTRLQNIVDHADIAQVQIKDSLPFIRWPLRYVRGLPSGMSFSIAASSMHIDTSMQDLISQFLLCISKLVAQGFMKEDFEEEIWDLVQLILLTHDTHHSHTLHVQLAFEIVAAFVANLPTNNSTDSFTRTHTEGEVRACTKHIIKALPPGDFEDLRPYATRILCEVDLQMRNLGGLEAILDSPEDRKRWQDIIKNFTWVYSDHSRENEGRPSESSV